MAAALAVNIKMALSSECSAERKTEAKQTWTCKGVDMQTNSICTTVYIICIYTNMHLSQLQTETQSQEVNGHWHC